MVANFKEAFTKTMVIEGEYSDHSADKGGETYRGISRENHPDWDGWAIIDKLKPTDGINNQFKDKLKSNTRLQKKVESFYKQYYWETILGDKIPNQEIAEKVFDLGVNMGVGRSVKFLQESLNLLNRNQNDYPDTVVDGGLGPLTLKTIKSFLKVEKKDPSYLLKLISLFQGRQYINIMKNAPQQEIFARGWLNRIKI